MTLANIFFSFGLLMAALAQILAYRGGERSWLRFTAMCFGITATLLLFVAGQIASIGNVKFVGAHTAQIPGPK